MDTKLNFRLAFGLTIAVCLAACGDDGNNPGPGDAATRKDAPDAAKPADGKNDAPASDLPGDPMGQPDAPSLDGPSPGRLDVGIDVQWSGDGGRDVTGPTVDVSGDSTVDAPATDGPADIAYGDSALDGGRASVDTGPVCTDGTQEICASPGNPLIGACHSGIRACMGGVWGPCNEVLPAAAEQCNGVDDDCNGMIDEGCVAGCTVVCAKCAGASDNPATADGSVAHPFASVEGAISATNPADGGKTQRRICIVGGSRCNESTIYSSAASLKVPDGIIIQGSYAITEEGLVYCPGATIRPKTILSFTANEGVIFDQTVATSAELSGVFVEINPPATAGPLATTASAIAIKGAKNVTLSRVFVSEGFVATTTYGVAITSGGQATITGSSISTGEGRTTAVGLYVNGGTVNLRDNCDRLVDGKCASYCDDGGSMLGVHGYAPTNLSDAPSQCSSVFITGGESSLIGNMICGGSSSVADGASIPAVAALHCEGVGCKTVSGNVIKGGYGRDAVAVAAVDADPLLDGNLIEGGCGDRSTTGTRLESSSARLQNNRIFASQCAGTGVRTFYGLHLLSAGTSHNPDVHSNDIEPLGIPGDCQSIGVLVEHTSGGGSATTGILRNNIVSAGVCDRRVALSEGADASLQALRNNDLYGPAGASSASTLVLYRRGTTDATTVAQVNAIALASGNLSADPEYASYSRDLHLTAKSPCIDRGTSESSPATDADGKARPAGAGYDIGAYESTP